MNGIEKTNILQENLCIEKIISVIKGENPQCRKLLKVSGRHSDAFVYVLSGSCLYEFDGQTEFEAKAGDVFYLPYLSNYTMYIKTEDYKFIFCDFEFEKGEPRRSFLMEARGVQNIDSLFLKLFNRHRSSAENTYAECMSLLYGIYGTLQQNNGQRYLDKSKKNGIAKARRYMEEGFKSTELSVSGIAEKMGVSEAYFRRLFKAEYGIPPAQYLVSLRLKNAKRLMGYPFLTLTECALQSGFSSLQYFCRVFKKETGTTPGKYKGERERNK